MGFVSGDLIKFQAHLERENFQHVDELFSYKGQRAGTMAVAQKMIELAGDTNNGVLNDSGTLRKSYKPIYNGDHAMITLWDSPSPWGKTTQEYAPYAWTHTPRRGPGVYNPSAGTGSPYWWLQIETAYKEELEGEYIRAARGAAGV
jgi:hypothetical protein